MEKQTSVEAQLDLVSIAASMFARASKEYANSMTAQAAYMAIECQEKRLDPWDLEDALLSDEETLSRLIKYANREHDGNLGKGKLNVGINRMRKVIATDFMFARAFKEHETSDLQKILTLYSRLPSEDRIRRESILLGYANMLGKRNLKEVVLVGILEAVTEVNARIGYIKPFFGLVKK